MSQDVRVLHVDDDPDICEVTALQLEATEPGMTVTTETDPESALETLAAERVDCIVSDFDMPGMNGLELLEAVRADDADLPFILLTGKGSEEIASRAIGAGVTGYLQKKSGAEQYEMLANRITNAVDRYRSKGALATSQRRFQRLVDQAPLALVEWNGGFEVLRWNEAAAELFGYSAEAAMGMHVSELLTESGVACLADWGSDLLEAGSQTGRQAAVTSDGDRIVCEWHSLTVDDGDTRSTFTFLQDVTERHERERELRRYETMVETVVDGVYTLDEDLHFTTVNEGMVALTGYDRDRLVGAHLSLVLDDEDIERVEDGRDRTRASSSDTNTLDLTLLTAEGASVECTVRYRVQREDGAFTGTAGVFRPTD